MTVRTVQPRGRRAANGSLVSEKNGWGSVESGQDGLCAQIQAPDFQAPATYET